MFQTDHTVIPSMKSGWKRSLPGAAIRKIPFSVKAPLKVLSRGQNEAGDPWEKGYTRINPAYFDLTDLRVDWLVRNGLVPNILGSWGYYIKWMDAGKMKKHWRYLIARYGAYPVTWTLCGEATLACYPGLGDEWEKYTGLYSMTPSPAMHILTAGWNRTNRADGYCHRHPSARTGLWW